MGLQVSQRFVRAKTVPRVAPYVGFEALKREL